MIFFLVLKMSLISILFMYALVLYKFNFDFSKVSLLVTLKWFLQDSARLLTHACIELKNKQTEVVHENSEDLNQKN